MPEKLYTAGEVTRIFGVSYVAVKRWAYAGKINYIKTPGGKYRYPESEIRRLLGEQMPKGKSPSTQGSARLTKKRISRGRSRN